MKLEDLKVAVITKNPYKLTLKDLLSLAREFKNHVDFDFGSLSKYRSSLPSDDDYSKDSLVLKIQAASRILVAPDEEEDEVLPEGMVGSLDQPIQDDLIHLKSIGKSIDGSYQAIFSSSDGEITGSLFVEDFVKASRKQVTNFRLPVLEVRGLQLHVTHRFHDYVMRDYVDDYDHDFVMWFKQFGIPDGEIPEYDADGKLVMVPISQEVPAVKIVPIFEELPEGADEYRRKGPRKIVSVVKQPTTTEISVNYPLYKYIKSGEVIPLVLGSEDYDVCHALWHWITSSAFMLEDEKGNPKERRWVLGEPKDLKFFAASKEVWREIFNQDLYDPATGFFDKNPNKTWKAVTGTPREMVGLGATRKKFRLRLVEEEYFKPESLKFDLMLHGLTGEALEEAWGKILGYKQYDGVIHTNNVKVRALTKRNFRPPVKPKALSKWKGPKWQYVRSITQIRSGLGAPAAMKGTMSSDGDLFVHRCKVHGFKLEDQDGIATMDIIKTNKGHYNHGDIIEFDTSDIEVIKFRMSDWSSTLGTQAIRLHTPSVRQLLIENGAPELAKLMCKAAEGRMKPLFECLSYGGKETSWQDAKTFAARLIIGSRYVPEWGDHRVALYSGTRNTVNARLRTFMVEHILKISLWDRAYYFQTDDRLDREEEYVHQKKVKAAHVEYVAGGGKLDFERWAAHPDGGGLVPFEYICRPPNTNEVRTLAKNPEFKWNLGGNPMVGPGNLMGFTVQFSNPNPTYDAWYLSHRAAKTMYRDVDGDMVIVGPSKMVKFPTFVAAPSKIEGDVEEKPVIVNDDDFLSKVLVPITDQAFTNSTSVGRLDNLTRRIVMERWWAWDKFQDLLESGRLNGVVPQDEVARKAYIAKFKPLTSSERLEMGQIVENYISGLKHAGKFLKLKEMEDFLKSTYGVLNHKTGKRSVGSVASSPSDYLILRPDVGIRGGDKGSPSAQLVHLSHRVKTTKFHELNPFDVVFNELKDMNIVLHHEDSVWVQKGFIAEWSVIQQRCGKGVYPWQLRDVVTAGTILGKGYSKEAGILGKMDLDPRDRRNAWTDLHNKYKDQINEILAARFDDVTSGWALCFARQMACYIGTLYFGMGDNDRSKGGSCFWCFDLVDVVLFWAQYWDKPVGTPGGRRDPGHPANEYLAKVVEFATRTPEEQDTSYFENEGGDED